MKKFDTDKKSNINFVYKNEFEDELNNILKISQQ